MKEKTILYFKHYKDILQDFFDKDASLYSASIAFFTIFSLPSLILIVLQIASLFISDYNFENYFIKQVGQMIGSKQANGLREIFSRIENVDTGVLPSIIGIGTLVFSSTTVLVSLQQGLDKMMGFSSKKQFFISLIVKRVLSLAMLVCFGFLLLTSLLLDTGFKIFYDYVLNLTHESILIVLQGLEYLISSSVIFLLFLLLFKVLPEKKMNWRELKKGAIITAFFFLIGKYLMGYYLSTLTFISSYGAAGTILLVIIWIYYSSFIILFGIFLSQRKLRVVHSVEKNPLLGIDEEK